MPRSIVSWFAVCWSLFLVAALVVGGMLIALYKETTAQRTARAAAGLARACETVANEYRAVAPGAGPQSASTGVGRALTPFPGVEGGVWKIGSGSVAYAFPTYEGTGQKTDLPQAEEPTIRQVAETAAAAARPFDWKRDSRSQILLLHACPIEGAGSAVAAWAMTRIVTVGGRPFLLATSGLAFLLLVLLGSAALLGRVLWRWSHRLGKIEAALSAGAADLPVLEMTGQRDLDRIVTAINGAGAKASEAHRRTEGLLLRVADGERLAALGRVAAGVAHEIRNPMAAMRLKAENALANKADGGRTADALQVVVEQVGRMDVLLKNMLRSVQRSDVQREPITNLGQFLGQHASLFREQAARRVVSVEAPEEAAPVWFDAQKVGGAIDNLILNAIQNSNDGTSIRLRGELSGDRLRLSVADQGNGVPADIRDHLFELFASGRPDGTGLGLAIVKEVAEAHGGRAYVEHRADGTTFTIDLPAGKPT